MNQTPSCDNCGHTADGRFCPNCGQSTRNFKQPLTNFIAEFAGELFSLDSRLAGTFKPLFFRPGFVAAEFVSGKRAKFVPPARLYIFASFAMFLTLALSRAPVNVRTTTTGMDSTDEIVDTTTTNTQGAADTTSTEANEVGFFAKRFGRGLRTVTENPNAFRREFFNRMAQAMFVLVPVFAVFLKVLYRSRLYVEHLVYSVYFHSVVFLVVAAINLPSDFGLFVLTQFGAILLLGIPVHLFIGMRRMYGETRLRTTMKFLLLSGSYTVFMLATSLLVLGLTLLLL